MLVNVACVDAAEARIDMAVVEARVDVAVVEARVDVALSMRLALTWLR